MRLLLLILSLYAVAWPGQAAMYKWVDDQGKVHFSDTPPSKEAEEYKPPPIQVMPAGPTGDFKSNVEKPKKIKYESLSVIAPEPDTVFTPDKASNVQVSLTLEPALDAQHKIALYLDGAMHTIGKQRNFTLTSLPRGTHTVFAAVLDEKNRKLISSDSVSFHIQRHHR
jgi:hypothetical protein